MGESRLRRVGALLRLSGALLSQRLRYTATRRTLLAVLGIALAVGLFITVSGVSVALATQGSVVSSDVDYWITPESASSSTLPVSVDGAQFGAVHNVSERLTERDDIAYASPVAANVLKVTHANASEYVVLIGVIAHPDLRVAGVSATNLTPGDPYYAAGSYRGPWTGEIVLSTGASRLLNANVSDRLRPNTPQAASQNRSFTVTSISNGGESGVGSVPIGIVHLGELQSLTDATESDTADQILVATNDMAVRGDLEQTYPNSNVVARSDSGLSTLTESKLALALAAGGFLVSLVIGVLFVATTLGLEIQTDRRLWATLTAIGFATSSRALIILFQTLLLGVAGGIAGLLLGRGGVWAANQALQSIVAETTVAVYPPQFTVYGFLVAISIALLTTPYLVWLTARGETLTVLRS